MHPSLFSFHPLWPPVWPAARDELWRVRARSVYPEQRRISSVSRYTAWSWTNKQTNRSVQFTQRESKTARGHFFIVLGWGYGNVYSLCLFFLRARVFLPLPLLMAPTFYFERCLDSNPESCRSKQVRYPSPYQLSHSSPYQLSHPSPYQLSHQSPW